MEAMSTVPKTWTRETGLAEKRDVWTAIKRGFRGRCPRCGEGKLFRAFLKVDDHCPVCGLDRPLLTAIRRTEPTVLLIETNYSPPVWFAFVTYLPFTLIASLALLQPVKGTVVGLQWALRMHGFDENAPSEIPPV